MAATRSSAAPAIEVEEARPAIGTSARQSSPVQEELFEPVEKEQLRVVAMPRRTPAPHKVHSYGKPGNPQQRFDFAHGHNPPTTAEQRVIYCDAPVARPMHRLFAAALDGSIVTISFGLFMILLYLAGARTTFDKSAIPAFVAMGLATMTLYRLVWCMADLDSFGLRWAGLQLLNFDGAQPDRSERLHRMVTSYISLAAGGLGLLWAVVDEEKLSWHDHMSKTFPSPAGRQKRRRPN